MGPGIPTLRSEVSSLLSAARPADLLSTIQHLEACRVDLYLDQQNIDTTTPMGRLVYQVTGAFAEFERSLIKQRVRAGLDRARPRKEAWSTAHRFGDRESDPSRAGRRRQGPIEDRCRFRCWLGHGPTN